MDAKEKENLLKKIASLFTLGDKSRNSSEGEVNAALAKAQELMRKYNISMSEVSRTQDKKGQETRWKKSQVGIFKDGKRVNFALWEQSLLSAVEFITDTKKIYIETGNRIGNKTQKWVLFLGDEADVLIASLMFNYLYKHAKGLAKELFGSAHTPQHRSFYDGFARRVYERCKESKYNRDNPDEANRYAMVISEKKNWLEKEIDKEFGGTLKNKRRSTPRKEIDPLAFAMGHMEGGKVDLETRNRLGGN